MNEEIQMFHNLNETLIVHWMNYERTDSNENLSYRSFWKIQQYEKDVSTCFYSSMFQSEYWTKRISKLY